MLHPHEEALIRAFVVRERRARWREALASGKRRRAFLDRLNHCDDWDERYCRTLAVESGTTPAVLRADLPSTVYLISDEAELDGRELPPAEALELVARADFGTVISYIPGVLAYYQDEAGSRRRLILQRERG